MIVTLRFLGGFGMVWVFGAGGIWVKGFFAWCRFLGVRVNWYGMGGLWSLETRDQRRRSLRHDTIYNNLLV